MLRSILFLFLFGSAVGQRSSGYGDRQTAKLSNNKEDGEQISLGAGPSNGALTIDSEFYNIRENPMYPGERLEHSLTASLQQRSVYIGAQNQE